MPRQQQQQQPQLGHQQFQQHPGQIPLDLSQLQSQQNWTLTPLETLAEVSRQQITHLNEHVDDGGQSQHHAMTGAELMSGVVTSAGPGDQYHPHDQFVSHSPQPAPHGSSSSHAEDRQGQSSAPNIRGGLSSSWDMTIPDLTPLTGAMNDERQNQVEEQQAREQSLVPKEEPATVSNEAPNLTVAAAAAARLSSATMMDPTMFDSLASHVAANLAGSLGEEHAQPIGGVEPVEGPEAKHIRVTPPPPPAPQGAAPTPSTHMGHPSPDIRSPTLMSPSDAARLANAARNDVSPAPEQPHQQAHDEQIRPPADASAGNTQLPWGQFTYMTNPTAPPKTQGSVPAMQPMLGIPTRSVFRVDQNGIRNRHSRARFSEPRRKEVQTIRRIGACIRCRILRKTCSQGDPCDTCRKVLTPRIWNTGCIRTKFTDKLDLYGARIQVHHSTRAVAEITRAKDMNQPIVVLEATHSSEGVALVFDALRGVNHGEVVDSSQPEEYQTVVPKIVMADTHADLPEMMQGYLDQILPELVNKEDSSFSRITLEMALEQRALTGNKVLKLALDLWGYVEIIERELKWTYTVQASPVAREKARAITKETDQELFKTLGFQLSAAAELKAEVTSKHLLLLMGRDLQDGRTAIDRATFYAIMLLLISVEKSTWAFFTWERVPQLAEQWPLSTPPGDFTGQGDQLAELLRMLLTIRKALPKTVVREADGVLVAEEEGYREYFERINLKGGLLPPQSLLHVMIALTLYNTAADVVHSRLHPPFLATTSRSLELRYCSTILLPEHLLPPQEGIEAPAAPEAGPASHQGSGPDENSQGGPETELPYDASQGGADGAGGADGGASSLQAAV